MVHIVSQRSHPVRPLRHVYFRRLDQPSLSRVVWSAARLGPILFLLYTADLVTYCGSFSVTTGGHVRRRYADNMASAVQQQPHSICMYRRRSRVDAPMQSNRLNTMKTEVIWCASNRRQHQLQ